MSEKALKSFINTSALLAYTGLPFLVCLCMGGCTHVCVCIRMCHPCPQRPEASLGCHSSGALPYSWSLTGLGLLIPANPGVSCLCHWDYIYVPQSPALCHGFWGLHSVPHVHMVNTFLTEPLPQPYGLSYFKISLGLCNGGGTCF